MPPMTLIIRAVILTGVAIFILAALMSLAGLPVGDFVFALLWVFFGGIGLWIAFYAFREVRNARDWRSLCWPAGS